MSFNVQWLPQAETELAALYIRAANKDAITLYVRGAEKVLARDPLSQGESRESDQHRLWFYRPLSLGYRLDDAAKVVFVVGVKWVGL